MHCLFEPQLAAAIWILPAVLLSLFCPSQLPTGLYKKVLVILHDSVLPYMNEPTLMMDFLTVAYGIGEWEQPFILCGTSSMGQMEALLGVAPWPGWWNRCTPGWDGAKELGSTPLSLKVRWFYLCLSMSLLLVCKEKSYLRLWGRVEYWSDLF